MYLSPAPHSKDELVVDSGVRRRCCEGAQRDDSIKVSLWRLSRLEPIQRFISPECVDVCRGWDGEETPVIGKYAFF